MAGSNQIITGEISIYNEYQGMGIGKSLMQAILESSEKHGIWILTASMFPENIASIHLHEKSDFLKVGYRDKIAQLEGIWKTSFIYELRSRNFQ